MNVPLYLSLIEIDLSINAEKGKSDNTDYLVEGSRAFLQHGDIGADGVFLVLLVKLMHAMEIFNRASEPFRDISSEANRINQLHNRCVSAVNKQLAVGASCKNDVPDKLKPKIDEGLQLLAGEVRRIERERDRLKLRWLEIK